jgi:ribosomal protein L3 glutamine methyltransferase
VPYLFLLPDWPLNLEESITEAARRMEEAGLSFGHGTDNAWDEAAWLVLHALGLPVDEQADLALSLDETDAEAARRLVDERIRTRKPAAYLTGTTWFAGLPFETAEGVIVPRSHLAGFILDEGQPWIDSSKVLRILDLCTGSGCIAIAAAKAFPSAQVDATDIDPLALELARRNVARHDLDERVRIIDADLYPAEARRYDLILSNPPYVPSKELADLPEEYHHEPDRAFDGGIDGLDLVHKIIDGAADRLEPHGALVMEVGHSWSTLQNSRLELPFMWLETDVEDSGVFLLYRQDIKNLGKL